jgi:uncharacterized membrane protein
MPVTINGSPTHVLIVHVVVVLLPIAVLASLVLVLIPATRRAFAVLTLLVAAVACLAIPFAFVSGKQLERRLPPNPLIARHVQLAHELLPLAAVFGVVLAVFVVVDMVKRSHSGLLNDFERRLKPFRSGSHSPVPSTSSSRLVRAHRVCASLLVVLAVLTGIQVYRVGDAGAKAAWSGRLSPSAPPPGAPKR